MTPTWKQFGLMVVIVLGLSTWMVLSLDRSAILERLGVIGAVAFGGVAVLTWQSGGTITPQRLSIIAWCATWGAWMVYATLFVNRGDTLPFYALRGLYALMATTAVIAVLLFPWGELLHRLRLAGDETAWRCRRAVRRLRPGGGR